MATGALGYIGLENDSDTSGAAVAVNLLTGLLWEFGVATTTVTMSDLLGTSCAGYGGCANCPSTDACLSTCPITQYPVTDSATCIPCTTCPDGCVRGDNCYLCYDIYCTTCSTFETGSCTNCEGATTLANSRCVCSERNIYGELMTRGDDESYCCAHGCGACTAEVHFVACTACLDDKYG
jgi:hypothetical protein